MLTWKNVVRGLPVLLLAALVSPARGQERPEKDDPLGGPVRRTSEPHESSAKADADAPPRDRPAPAPEKGSSDAAEQSKGFGWPWGGPRSPEWTQDWTWANTHFWLMDVGHVELNLRWDTAILRRSADLDHLFNAEARIGILPHIELDVGEDVSWPAHGDLQQQGNEIGARFNFWDYGTIPLNPTVEVVYRPRHDATDEWEGRVMAGFELFSRFRIAGDGFFRGETGGAHNYTWGFHAGASYELWEHVLRIGAEGGITWRFSPDHKEAFRDTDPEVGPTVVFRPLALFKPEWAQRFKLTTGAQFGARDDNTNVPYARVFAIIGVQF